MHAQQDLMLTGNLKFFVIFFELNKAIIILNNNVKSNVHNHGHFTWHFGKQASRIIMKKGALLVLADILFADD